MQQLELKVIRIDGGTQSRVELNNTTVEEYSEAMADGVQFPPVVVFCDGASHWLADGFHRYFGADHAGLGKIAADVRNGTQRDAVLYSLKANATHGLKRTNADKRKAVETLLKDSEWAAWSDRKIAEVCGVSHPFVAAIRKPYVAAKQQENRAASAAKKTGVESDSTPSESKPKAAEPKAAAIAKLPVEKQAAAIAKPIHKKEAPEPQQQEEDEYTELDALADQVRDLQAEVARLKLLVPAEADEGNDMLKEMQHEMATLRQANKAITIARDRFQAENAELKRQCVWLKKQLDKQK